MAMIVVGFAVAIAANLVVKEMPSSWTAVDATSTKLYSLTDTTKDYVKNLSQDVTIYVLSSEKSADSTLAETLQRYEDLSKFKGGLQGSGEEPEFLSAVHGQCAEPEQYDCGVGREIESGGLQRRL